MLRPLLLVAVTSLALLGGASATAPVGAQEIITATGSVDVPSVTELGLDLESSEIELSFPAEGGTVTGTWTTRLRFELISNEERCVYIGTASGRLEGTYDGGAVLGGRTMGTGSVSVVAGCTGIGFDTDPETYDWSATFDGERVHVTFDSPDFPIRFTALVTSAGDADAGDADADAGPPPDAAEDAAPPDDSPDIAGVFFGTDYFTDLEPRIEELADCLETTRENPSHSSCRGGQAAKDDSSAFFTAFDRSESGLSPHAVDMAWVLADVIQFTRLLGPDQRPLLPSLIAAGPVIERLADLTDLEATDQEQGVTTVVRFVGLLAAQDAAGWEKRYP